jgi:hypothetical protein
LFLTKANRLSTKKKDLTTSRKGAPIAEEQGSNRGTITGVAEEVSETDGRIKRE